LTRFRLRFLLQEIDLPQGDTFLGRSASCQVTLDDPLVSREHARITIRGADALIEDLRSRNGVQLNGMPLSGPMPLHHGDRVRIGTRELVFLKAPASEPAAAGATRQTGFMCECARCARPYPAEVPACPACGSKERVDDDTVTGRSRRDWGLELVAEAIARARTGGGVEDLERLLAHARSGIEQRLAQGNHLDRRLLDDVGLAAAELAAKRAEAGWGRWIFSIYASLGWAPPAALSELLSRLPPHELRTLSAVVRSVFDGSAARQSETDRAAHDALSRLLGSSEP
jgi:hypothetical protein